MAQRRMFNLKIIDSAKFLKMPLSSQLLYFHLCMRADDDGVVEGYNILKMTGINEDDLRVLTSKGFIKILNEDMVAFICDWRDHNSIRADRKIDSIYKDLLLQVLPEVALLPKKQRSDSKKYIGQSMDSPSLSTTNQVVGIEQNRTVQVRTVQVSIEQQQIMDMLKCDSNIAERLINITKNFHSGKDVVVVVKEKINVVNQGKFTNKVGALIAAIQNDWKPNVSSESNSLKFNNFTAREYDYDELERKLLGWDTNED